MSSSVNKYLREAELYVKAGESLKAENIYRKILTQFPQNKKAIRGYQKLKTPPQAEVNKLIDFFNRNQLKAAISLGQSLIKQYPGAIILYEILAAANMGLGIDSEAKKNYLKVLELSPDNTDAYNNLGMIFYQQGSFLAAVENYQKAVDIEPSFADAHYNLGNSLKQVGDITKAIESYRACLAIHPNDIEVLKNYSDALKEYGDFEQAIEVYEKILKLDPSLTDTRADLNKAIQEEEDVRKAIKEKLKRPSLIPEHAQFLHEMAIILYQRDNFEGSLKNLKNAIKICPIYTEAYLAMGEVLSKIGELDPVIDCYIKATKIDPKNAKAYNNLATIYKKKGCFYDALKNWKIAIEIDPNYTLAFSNLGSLQQEIGEFDAAIASYNRALTKDPNAVEVNFNQSLAYLHKQDFKLGWAKYEWRWKKGENKDLYLKSTKPRWNLYKNHRVLLWAEQGIGDEIMFSSLILDLYARCSKLIIKIDARLIPLFKRSFPNNIDFRARDKDVLETEYDSQISMGSLPQFLRPTIDSFKPTSRGWLSACRHRAHSLRKKLLSNEAETLIGISWHSTKLSNGVDKKLIDLTQLATTLQSPKVKLVNLQYGDVSHELDRLKKEKDIEVKQDHEIDVKNDIDGLAALIMACDTVVSISNLTIHLAGALGKKSQLLLTFSSDWRWGHNENKSYWYDTVSLLRQTEINNWDSVLKKL